MLRPETPLSWKAMFGALHGYRRAWDGKGVSVAWYLAGSLPTLFSAFIYSSAILDQLVEDHCRNLALNRRTSHEFTQLARLRVPRNDHHETIRLHANSEKRVVLV